MPQDVQLLVSNGDKFTLKPSHLSLQVTSDFSKAKEDAGKPAFALQRFSLVQLPEDVIVISENN